MDVAALEESLNFIVRRHESLRTVFRSTDSDGPRQIVLPELPPSLATIDMRRAGDEQTSRLAEALAQIQETPFDLSEGPLLRVGILRLADTQWLLVVAVHHIIW